MAKAASSLRSIFPKTPHQIIKEEDLKNREVFIIGDVHGCLLELEELLQQAEFNSNDKNILPIFVGDLVNKGPYNIQTIRKVRKMNAYCVRGNHEDHILKYFKLQENSDYALQSSLKWIKQLEPEDISFLVELPYTIRIPSMNVIIVHAGIVPGIPLEQQNVYNCTTMRNIYEEGGKLYATEIDSKCEAWASIWSGPEHVYF